MSTFTTYLQSHVHALKIFAPKLSSPAAAVPSVIPPASPVAPSHIIAALHATRTMPGARDFASPAPLSAFAHVGSCCILCHKQPRQPQSILCKTCEVQRVTETPLTEPSSLPSFDSPDPLYLRTCVVSTSSPAPATVGATPTIRRAVITTSSTVDDIAADAAATVTRKRKRDRRTRPPPSEAPPAPDTAGLYACRECPSQLRLLKVFLSSYYLDATTVHYVCMIKFFQRMFCICPFFCCCFCFFGARVMCLCLH